MHPRSQNKKVSIIGVARFWWSDAESGLSLMALPVLTLIDLISNESQICITAENSWKDLGEPQDKQLVVSFLQISTAKY